VCPSGFDWRRVTDGYNCKGRGTHFISDELLAEGRGGVFYVPAGPHGRLKPKWGPYYEDPNDPIPGSFIYAGDPSVACPEGMKDGCAVWPKIWKLVPGLTGMPQTQEEIDRLNDALAEVYGDRSMQLPPQNRAGDSDSFGFGNDNGMNFTFDGRQVPGMPDIGPGGMNFTINGRPMPGMPGMGPGIGFMFGNSRPFRGAGPRF
jgi:hypothetical protein